MMTEESKSGSKKVLTEAQRLAFLKGREKRMANIEKRRLEKEEQEQQTQAAETPTEPPASKTPVKVVITPPPAEEEVPAKRSRGFDDLFAKMVANEVVQSIKSEMPPPPPPRKPRATKPKLAAIPEPPAAPAEAPAEPTPRLHNFSWM